MRLLLAICACLLPGQSAALAISRVAAPRCRLVQPRRSTSLTMLEAFDLMPVVDCLKLPDMDAVQVCMDKLEPWMELTEGGDLSFSLNAINGFIGGSVGVIGTVIATLIKKGEVKERLKCVYCDGGGQILCGHCLGTGVISYADEFGKVTTEKCENCEGTGTVVCINCQGSGISVPEDILNVLGDAEVGTDPHACSRHQQTPHVLSSRTGRQAHHPTAPSPLRAWHADWLHGGGLHRAV